MLYVFYALFALAVALLPVAYAMGKVTGSDQSRKPA